MFFRCFCRGLCNLKLMAVTRAHVSANSHCHYPWIYTHIFRFGISYSPIFTQITRRYFVTFYWMLLPLLFQLSIPGLLLFVFCWNIAGDMFSFHQTDQKPIANVLEKNNWNEVLFDNVASCSRFRKIPPFL